MAQVLLDRGTRALVVRGDDGLDEISICATTRVWDATGSEVVEYQLDPRLWGIDFVDPHLLEGATPERNVELLTAALTPGNASDVELAKVRAIRDAVVVNAAAALTAFDAAVSQLPGIDVSDRIEANLPRARQALDSGAAWALLEKWIAAST